MNKQDALFNAILFLFIGIFLCGAWIMYPMITENTLIRAALKIIFVLLGLFISSIVLVKFYSKKYLTNPEFKKENSKLLRRVIFGFSVIAPTITDYCLNSWDYLRLEIIAIPSIIIASLIITRLTILDFPDRKKRFVYSISYSFSRFFIYLILVVILYSISVFNSSDLTIANYIQSILASAPNVFTRFLLSFPLLAIGALLSIFISNTDENIYSDLLDR